MKKFAFLVLTAGLILAGCTKDMPGTDPNAPQDVTFTSYIEGGGLLKGLKSGPADACPNADADYALVVIDGIKYYPSVFTVNNVLYTQAVKLVPGNHTVTVFALMQSAGDPLSKDDDVVVRAAPETAASFSAFVTAALPINFTVSAFEKMEVGIEVLCFEETNYTEFGFAWFKPNLLTIHQKWFFGDFCTEYFENYVGSLYGDFPKVDMPAIFKIEVTRDDAGDGSYSTVIGTYSNEGSYTVDVDGNASALPLGIKYVDRLDVEDKYRFTMYMYQEIMMDEEMEPVFDYVKRTDWYFSDAGTKLYLTPDYTETSEYFDAGEDNVYDFVLGFCVGVPADVYVPGEEEGGEGEETAFAKGGDLNVCFVEDGFGRWGWTNQLTPGTTYNLPIWAGAGQCDTEKGTLVGTLNVVFNGNGTATVTYTMNAPYKLEETHLYIGTAKYPKKGNKYTVAPGQFPDIHGDLASVSTDSYTITVPSGPVYVIAHAVVSGF